MINLKKSALAVTVFMLSACVSGLLSGCVTQSAMPLGNDMMQVDVSAAPIYSRAGAQQMAFKKAAQATVDGGYDKFIVVNNDGWNETGISGSSYGSASGDSFFSTYRHPEIKMVIHMYRYKERGAAKAVDAHKILNKENGKEAAQEN